MTPKYDMFGDDAVQACVAAFKSGKPVMVFDSAFRERETDLLWWGGGAPPPGGGGGGPAAGGGRRA